MKKYHLPLLIVVFLVISCNPKDPSSPRSQNDRIAQKVDSLLSIMTLQEKVGQLNMYNGFGEFTGPQAGDKSKQNAENVKAGRVGAMLNVLSVAETRKLQALAVENSRLGIPMMFGYDVIHGYKTMLPVPIAQAASWDYEGARLGARIAAKEAAASGLNWTFSPMIDVSRDARWGRIMEGAGEDPYLTSVMAKAWIEGYQGDDLADPLTIAACAKHFAGYAFAEAGRDYNTVDISPTTLYNVVLPPFLAAVEAGAATFMNAFNELDGVPATGSAFLQREILKGKWDYQGFVVSDWASIGELITHGYAADSTDAGLKAILAGSDMDMESRIYENELENLVEQGKVSESIIDDAVKRILKVKYELGLFDDPYRYCSEEREKATILSEENLSGSREVAKKTMVLLKNEGNLLPLSKQVGAIAVIGQLAGSKDIPLGNWRGRADSNSAVSLLEGIQAAVGTSTTVRYAQGYTLTTGTRDFIHDVTFADDDGSGFAEAKRIAKASDVVILAIGEDCFQTGESRSQVDIGLKGRQLDLLLELMKVNKNIVVVLMNGRPMTIPEVAANVPSILETWYAGSEAGNAIADVIFGDYNPSGKLPVSFPYHVGQEPLHYDRKNTGRPVTNAVDDGLVFWSHYADMTNDALFPFGHGLSYTTFEYSKVTAEVHDTGVTIGATVTNSGATAGEEVVQLYIRDLVASVTRPIKELKGFQKIQMEAGASQFVQFELSKKELSFYTSKGELVFEPGDFHFWIGSSSATTNQTSTKIP